MEEKNSKLDEFMKLFGVSPKMSEKKDENSTEEKILKFESEFRHIENVYTISIASKLMHRLCELFDSFIEQAKDDEGIILFFLSFAKKYLSKIPGRLRGWMISEDICTKEIELLEKCCDSVVNDIENTFSEHYGKILNSEDEDLIGISKDKKTLKDMEKEAIVLNFKSLFYEAFLEIKKERDFIMNRPKL